MCKIKELNQANPILVNIVRGKLTESFHRGAYCVIQNEKILDSAGNIEALIYPRSALKFFQVLPLLLLGGKKAFQFTDAEIAVMCASHNAEPYHLNLVSSILKKIGCKPADLACGAHLPMHEKSAFALLKSNTKPSAIHNNCSGKHAGFLALAVLNGFDKKNYLNPNSDVQLLVRNTMSDFFGYALEQNPAAIDGCSAPVYAMPLHILASGFQRFTDTSEFNQHYNNALKILKNCITKHPKAIAGTGRYDTELMKNAQANLLAKVGAEGIFGIACLRENIGIAIKIDDGKMAPQYSVAQQILIDLGILSKIQASKLEHWRKADVKNWNQIKTGYFTTNFTLI